MISNEAKLVDHCPKTPPSREPRSVDDEARKAAGCLDVRVDRLREFHKVVVLDRGLWLHVRDGMLGIEVVFDHVSLLYDRCGPRAELTDGVMRTFRLRTSGQSGPHRRGAGCSAIIGSRPLHDADARRNTGTHACAHPYRRTTTTMKKSDHQRRNTLSENVIHVGTGFVAKERAHVVEVLSTLGPHFVTRELISRREFTVGWDDE